MTATESIRAMLDERGVEWRGGLPTETIVKEPIDALYVERSDGMISVYFRSYLTPEQAIEATLGRGKCRMNESGLPVFNGHDDGYFSICSECGFVNYMRRAWLPIKFCPNCGRRVEVDE